MGNILVLAKLVFESIPIYWMTLAVIPKGVLERIYKLIFDFLWSSDKESDVMAWMK